MGESTPLTKGHTVSLTSGTSTSSRQNAPPRPIVNISTPVGMLGYGLREEETYDALSKLIQNGAPTAMVLDSGSTDSGPEKLALGCMSAPRSNYKRDLTKLLRLGHAFRVPVIFSSAGGDGSDEHVEEMIKILEEIAREKGNEHYRLKAIAIYSEVKKDFVRQRLASGAVSGCGKPVPQLTEEDIDSAPRICSQMGPEPFYDAMIANPDFNVIAGGRGYDPSPYVAYAAYATKTPFTNTATEEGRRMFGAFTHMGKILECGASCARPKGNGVVATIYEDGSFDIKPTDPNSKCTPTSVSAHSLYEKTRPDVLSGPGGKLDLMHTKYEQLDDGRTVRCSGADFVFSRDVGSPYQIKLEAARLVGYRSQYMGSYKDPILIGQIDTVLDRTRQYVHFQHQAVKEKWEMDWHIYGKDTFTKDGKPGEVFIIGEALAESQDLANSLVSTARVASVHVPYPGMKATAGAFAYGLGGKVELPLGACAEFSIYHLVNLEEGEERLALSADSNALYHQKVTMIGVPGLDATPLPAKMPANPKKKAMPIAIPDDGPSVLYERPAPTTLGELASVLRSKNAGPFELTFDVMFAFEDEYKLVKESGFLNAATVAQLCNVKEEDVVWSGFFDQALAYKATIPRLQRGKVRGNGGFMESDVHGSNKYLDLYYYPLPDEFIGKWKAMRA